MCPGLAWLPVALREKYLTQPGLRGFSSHSGCARKTEKAPVLPRGVFFGVTWGTGGTQGKGKDPVHAHTRASDMG